MPARNFDTNTERLPSFFDSTTYLYGWKNSEAVPDDKDFKVKWDELFAAIRGGFTAGSVLFAGSTGLISQDNANLFWDDTLNRLGIGTATPQDTLDVLGAFRVGANRIGANFYGKSKFLSIESTLNNSTGTIAESLFFDVNLTGAGAFSATNSIMIDVTDVTGTSITGNNRFQIGGALTPQTTRTIHSNAIHLLNFGQHVHLGGGELFGFGSTQAALAVSNGSSGTTWSGSAIGYNVGLRGSAAATATKGTNANFWGRDIITPTDANVTLSNQFWIGSNMAPASTSFNSCLVFGINAPDFVYQSVNRRMLFDGVLLSDAGIDPAATHYMAKKNGIAPTTTPADVHLYYSADAVAGNACPHFRTEAGNIVKLYSETTGVSAGAFVANTSGIADDTATFGGYTIGQVVQALKNFGLLT